MSDTKLKGSPKTTVVQKVNSYPIEILITRHNNPAPVKGSIVKLTEIGFLLRVAADHFYSVGENQSVDFQIPVYHYKIQCPTLVMKTYDSMAYSASEKLKIVEMHFVNLPQEHSKAIRKFLVNIGQVKPE
jgi:hypothetical protein